MSKTAEKVITLMGFPNGQIFRFVFFIKAGSFRPGRDDSLLESLLAIY